MLDLSDQYSKFQLDWKGFSSLLFFLYFCATCPPVSGTSLLRAVLDSIKILGL